MVTFWQGLGPETKAAIIGALSTLVVAIVGFGGLILQMRSQGRQQRDAIAENERRKLKAAMYNDAVTVSRSLADAAIDLSTQLRRMAMQVSVAAQAVSANLGYQMPSARYPALAAGYEAFSDAALRFIFLVENHRIVDPRILIFRTALSVVLHDSRKLMHWDFVMQVMPSLPTEGPDGHLFPYTPPSPDGAEAVRVMSERIIKSLDDAICYTEDFLVELQNRLLGDLFANQVSHRKPIDPNSKVITLEQAVELEQWFRTSTDWGQNNTRIEAETRDRLGQVEGD